MLLSSLSAVSTVETSSGFRTWREWPRVIHLLGFVPLGGFVLSPLRLLSTFSSPPERKVLKDTHREFPPAGFPGQLLQTRNLLFRSLLYQLPSMHLCGHITPSAGRQPSDDSCLMGYCA